jgi:hypothetical protein
MWNHEFDTRVAFEHHRDLLAEAAHDRLVAAAGARRLPLRRRAAQPLGRALLRLGASVLRYGHDAVPTLVQADQCTPGLLGRHR